MEREPSVGSGSSAGSGLSGGGLRWPSELKLNTEQLRFTTAPQSPLRPRPSTASAQEAGDPFVIWALTLTAWPWAAVVTEIQTPKDQ